MPLGGAQTYLAQYNGYQLPGYVQQETLPSTQNIQEHSAAYADGSNSEYTGLQNKTISLTLKVWEANYEACKEQVQKAATIVRSKRGGFAPLYVQYTDRYYEAMSGQIRVEKTAGESVRTLEYQVDFHCKPWLIAEDTETIGGAISSPTTISTTGRTIDDGGWTYATLTITGTNVTVSGYTTNGDFAGYVSVSGAVTNLVINSEDYTAEISGVNKNNLMKNVDYRMMVGPEVTNYRITGATNCTIQYRNRWYL